MTHALPDGSSTDSLLHRFLAHPVWLGVSGVAAILAVLISFVLLGHDKAPPSPAPGGVSPGFSRG